MADEPPQPTWLNEFWQDILPRVHDLVELKLLLHVLELWVGSGERPVELGQLLTPRVVRSAAGPGSPEPGELRVRRALEGAVVNGLLLRFSVGQGERFRTFFLPSLAATRELLDRLRANDPGAASKLELSPDAEVSIYRPNVFAVYERHIGPLTPLVAEQLRDAERAYPRVWLEEAIRSAAGANKRSWRYVQAILTRWEETGPDAAVARSS